MRNNFFYMQTGGNCQLYVIQLINRYCLRLLINKDLMVLQGIQKRLRDQEK